MHFFLLKEKLKDIYVPQEALCLFLSLFHQFRRQNYTKRLNLVFFLKKTNKYLSNNYVFIEITSKICELKCGSQKIKVSPSKLNTGKGFKKCSKISHYFLFNIDTSYLSPYFF